MPRLRLVYFNSDVVEIGIRIKTGLPLTAAPFVKAMLEGVLAKAQTLYPVHVCHYVVMSNHIHMIVVVQDMEDLAGFKQHFKTNTAKLIHAMLGTYGSIWEEGSDAPVVLDKKKLIKRLRYFYLNPQRAGLIDSIDDYPNLSTWHEVKRGGTQTYRHTKLPSIRRTPLVAKGGLNGKLVEQHTTAMKEATWEENVLTLSPRLCFQELGCSEEETDQLLQTLIESVKREEKELWRERERAGKKALGRLKLIYASLHAVWTPNKRGKRMICLGSCPKQRAAYIARHKRIVERCREIWQQWCVGNFLELPSYVYWPRRPCRRAVDPPPGL